MSALSFDTQRVALTIGAFVGSFIIALSVGRFLKRRASVQLGLLYQLFCLALAFYVALAVYGVQAPWRIHFAAAAILLSTALIVALVNRYIWDVYFERRKQTPIPHFLREVVALVIFVVALLFVLSFVYHAERGLKSVVATSGVAAVILGLAGQNLLGGIIAGISLQINRPYKVTDWLKVGDTYGEVMEINWRSTRLRTNDGIYLDIPNNETNDAVRTNVWYELKRQRIRIPYPIRTLHLERHAPKPVEEGHEEARAILRGEPLFHCLSDGQIDNLVKQSELNHFGRGERVIEEGAEGDSMFILLRGAAQVSISKNGSTIPVATLRSGDCFGEMSLLTGEKRSATVRAEGDCYVMEISKDVMGEVIRESPDCLKQLSELLAKRKMETEGILKDLATSSADQAAKQREYTATFLKRLKTFFAL